MPNDPRGGYLQSINQQSFIRRRLQIDQQCPRNMIKIN